jgi:micrococcal nuclease
VTRLGGAKQRIVVVVVVVLAASFAGRWLGEVHRATDAPWRVTRVDDGDTIVVARGSETDVVRLLGIDTPETHHPTKPVQCFGPEASAFTTRRLTGRLVRLERDVEERDIYGRRLAYVMLGGRRFNDELLRRGYARLLVIAPNGAYGRQMLDAELDARHRRRGLWAACE